LPVLLQLIKLSDWVMYCK